MVGPSGLHQVPTVHTILKRLLNDVRRTSISPTILWCYEKTLQFSLNTTKRNDEFKKLQQKGLLNKDDPNPLSALMNSTTIRYCKYRDTSGILGRTFGMLVLQDFQGITPNNLARTFETVSGGGAILLILDTLRDIEDLHKIAMSFQGDIRSESSGPVTNRFNIRFLSSLKSCGNFVAIDSKFNLLQKVQSAPIIRAMPTSDAELSRLKAEHVDASLVGPLLSQAVTVDQARTVLQLFALLDKFQMNKVVGLTAARGRGKSAALGFVLSYAIVIGYSNVFVTSPSASNVATLFELVVKGLDLLGYRETVDYQSHLNEQKDVVKVSIRKRQRQVVQYVHPSRPDFLGQCEILAIDEAAAIPLPKVKKLIGPFICLLSSTVNGYEGTCRSLSLKLFNMLRKTRDRDFSEIQMASPIRYASNDPIESWLNQLLCLNVEPRDPEAFPEPRTCDLMSVDRDLLFRGVPATESLLESLVSLSVASHYRNEPDDLVRMSDGPNQKLFAMLPPVAARQIDAGNVIGYVQAAIEDVPPVTVAGRVGLRIVRVAIHPAMQGKGYGSEAIRQLLEFYGTPEPQGRDGQAPLLRRLGETWHERVEYAGVSFGLSEELFRFWNRLGFLPVDLATGTDAQTGEHAMVMLKEIGDEMGWVRELTREFRMRFGRLLGLEFREFAPRLCDLIYGAVEGGERRKVTGMFRENDVARMQAFLKKQIQFPIVLDLVPRLCELTFEKNADVKLTRLMRTILIVMGYQHLGVPEVAERLQLDENRVYEFLEKMFGVLTEYVADRDRLEDVRQKASVPIE
jgi:N-acetyltransferase 10